ncbi:MAG: hypothetical protein ACRD1K_02330, partial [Acidimicrobiales bacterium]
MASTMVAGCAPPRPEPAAVRPGEPVRLSGAGCLLDGRATDSALVALSRLVDDTGGPFDASARYPVRADGTWAGVLTVPSTAPAGRYVVTTSCSVADQVLPGGQSALEVAAPSAAVPAGAGRHGAGRAPA